MLNLTRLRLDDATQLELTGWQAELDQIPTYDARRLATKREWRNKSSRDAMDPVRQALRDMCPGIERCMFCLDSAAHEIEHFRPKALFPSALFQWSNMFFICGACNREKLAKFKCLAADGTMHMATINLILGGQLSEDSLAVLLNPIDDNPENFLALDISGGTFRITPRVDLSNPNKQRAEETIKILALNSRDVLVKRRKTAYEDLRIWLRYVANRYQAADIGAVAEIRATLIANCNLFVWREMQRQQERIPDLQSLFQNLPAEVLRW